MVISALTLGAALTTILFVKEVHSSHTPSLIPTNTPHQTYHPDKTTNPSAPEAFDRLKKAQTALLDEKERSRLDEAIADARRQRGCFRAEAADEHRRWLPFHPATGRGEHGAQLAGGTIGSRPVALVDGDDVGAGGEHGPG